MSRHSGIRILFRTTGISMAVLALFALVLAVRVALPQERPPTAMRIEAAMARLKQKAANGKEDSAKRPLIRYDSAAERTRSQDEAAARTERLTALGNRMKSIEQIDSLQGVNDTDKAFLKRRYKILHPID